MLLSQFYYLRNLFLSNWRDSEASPISGPDISFDETTNTISSLMTDLSIDDYWIFVQAGTQVSNSGYFRVSESTSSTITLDSTFRTVVSQASGETIKIYPLICPIKFGGLDFSYVNDKLDFFVELIISSGASVPWTRSTGTAGEVSERYIGFIAMTSHLPTGYGEEFAIYLKEKFKGIFRYGNIGKRISVINEITTAGRKDDQKEFWVTTTTLELDIRVGEKARQEENATPLTSSVFGGQTSDIVRIDVANSFEKFSAIYYDELSSTWKVPAPLSVDSPTHIVLYAEPTFFLAKSEGTVRFNFPHGLVQSTYYLDDSSNPNITTIEPSVGKYQKLFDVTDGSELDISIGELLII